MITVIRATAYSNSGERVTLKEIEPFDDVRSAREYYKKRLSESFEVKYVYLIYTENDTSKAAEI